MHPIYLDNASTSFPKPACVPDAVYRYMTACGSNVSRGGYRSAYSAEELVLRRAAALCAIFMAGTRCVVFTPNITTSLNLLLKGFLHRGPCAGVVHGAQRCHAPAAAAGSCGRDV